MSPCRLSRNATECADHAEIHLYAVSESINQSIDRSIEKNIRRCCTVIWTIGYFVL